MNFKKSCFNAFVGLVHCSYCREVPAVQELDIKSGLQPKEKQDIHNITVRYRTQYREDIQGEF